jgi:hypothetical protein
VVFHLLRAAALIKDRETQDSSKVSWLEGMKYVHFVKDNEFKEIEEFRNFIE